MNMIGIEYTEFEPGTYKQVYLMPDEGNVQTFASGDVVKDFQDAIGACEGDYAFSSTVYDFCSDENGKYTVASGVLERTK